MGTWEDGGVENPLPPAGTAAHSEATGQDPPESAQDGDQPSTRPGAAALVREGLLALAVAAVVALVGLPLGLLWRAIAPSVELVRTDFGWYPIEESPEGFVAGDGWFALIGAGAGLLVALAVWLLLRDWRGPVMLIALAIGSLAAAYAAQWLGHAIGLADYQRQVRAATSGVLLSRQVGLREDVVMLSQAVCAVGLYTLLAAFHYAPSLRNSDLSEVVAEPDPPEGQ